MMQPNGLNNRVLKTLSQSASKAAVDLLGMRLSTSIDNKFVELMITETEAYGRKSTDKMALLNTYKNIPTSHLINDLDNEIDETRQCTLEPCDACLLTVSKQGLQ